jgi:HEAT repeat protein
MYLSFYAGPREIPLFRPLLKWLQNDPNVADNALRMLGRWGDKESIPVLEKAIDSFALWGNSPWMATEALSQMGATSSTKAFLTLARKSHSEGALTVLATMGNKDAIPGIRDFLTPPSPSAIVALADLDDRESLPVIRTFLQHEDRRVREAACTALAIFHDEASIPAIQQLRKEAEDARRIWPVLGPVKPAPPPPDVDELLRRLKDPTYVSERITTAIALLRKGRREGLPVLFENEYYCSFALNALRRPGQFEEFQRKAAPIRLYAPYQQLHERLALIAGLKLQELPQGIDEWKAWTDVHHSIQHRGRPPTLAEAYQIIEDDRWAVVLEEDRIRILPFDEARQFWTRWLAGEEK